MTFIGASSQTGQSAKGEFQGLILFGKAKAHHALVKAIGVKG
jgi:hypothetical protein